MFENKNILFVYSGLDNNLKVQQSFVFIKSLIDEFKEHCNSISILTTTDEIGLFIFDANIKICQDAINDKTLMNIIDEKKIDVLVPICGCEQTDKIIHKIYHKLKNKKVKLFQDDYFSKNKSKTYFQDIAQKIGFNLYKKRTSQKRELCKEFFATCINDSFGNQVIFDICDYATINNKKFFLSHSVLLKKNNKKKVSRILNSFGKQITIANIPYTIHFSEYSDGKIYFEKIEFGFSFEALFVINANRINIQKIIINCVKYIPMCYQSHVDYFSYAYNYEITGNIHFAINFEDINFNISTNDVYQHTNDELFYRLCLFNETKRTILKNITLIDNDEFYIQTSTNCNKIHYNRYEEYILVYCDDTTINDIGSLIVFISLCEKLKQKTTKRLCFIASTYVPLFKCCEIDTFFIINNNLTWSIDFVIKSLNIKKAFLNSFQNHNDIINLLHNNKIDIYGFNYNDNILYQNDIYKKELFCKTLGLQYNEFCENDGIVYDFFCIKDGHNNEYLQTTMNNLFFKNINVSGLMYPCVEMNFDVKEQLNNVIDSILANIQTSGIVNIKMVYYNGDVYISHIDITMTLSILFKLNWQDKNKYFNCLIESILGKNIDMFARSNKLNNINNFDKTIIFSLTNNKTITINGKTKNDVLEKFTKIIIDNDKEQH